MRIKKFLFPALLVCPVLALIYRLFTRAVAKPAPEKPTSNRASYDAIDAYIEGQMRRLKIPGASLAIVEGDQIMHQRGFGQAHPGGEAPTCQTTFFIGSLTKSFTAVAIMQLVEAGKVELDGGVQRYLPWFRVADPQASAQMTVRHLLNQTSGLPMLLGLANLGDLDNCPDATELQARSLYNMVLTRPAGTKFEYSNLNYNILGLIVEATSGESYPDYLQKHIFDPLGMSRSYTSPAVAKENGLATGYRFWFGYPFPAPNLPVPRGSLPSGQLISNTEDMAHYLIAHLNAGRYGDVQILSDASMDEMHHGVADINEMGLSIGSYGMGWISQGTGKSRIVWHSGDMPNFKGFMALVPEQNKAMVLLFNANHALIKMKLDEVMLGAAELLAGEPPSPLHFPMLPLVMPGMLLIPALQIIEVVATLRLLSHWRADPATQPSRGRMWRQHILFPLIPNLLAALTLVPMLGKMRGFLMLFMPDFSWVAQICGSFAGIWTFLRTGLILRALGRLSRR
jgi:CubicO group peptidase (beta-lactamase class C family)